MIAIVSQAEERLARGRKSVFAAGRAARRDRRRRRDRADPARRLRAARSGRPGRLQALRARFSRRRRRCSISSTAPSCARYGLAGVATPDHTIRTKNYPLIVPPPEAGGSTRSPPRRARRSSGFVAEYHAYFARHNAVVGGQEARTRPDAAGRSWCRGSGCSGSGAAPGTPRSPPTSPKCWVATVTDAEAVGTFESLTEAELFEMEYWSLEQAKLGGAVEKPLAGQVALVTGGAGTIGLATARALRGAGAEIALLDRAGSRCRGRGEKARRHRHRRRRDRCRPRCAPPSTASSSASAGSTSSSRTPARPGRAASARSTNRRCATASS